MIAPNACSDLVHLVFFISIVSDGSLGHSTPLTDLISYLPWFKLLKWNKTHWRRDIFMHTEP